jgi:hypothetical protein
MISVIKYKEELKTFLENNKEIAENLISKDPNMAYDYALDTLKDRFPLGEEAICQNPRCLWLYSKNIIKGKLPETMHNAMLSHGIKDSNNIFVKVYLKNINKKIPKRPSKKNVDLQTFFKVCMKYIREKNIKDAAKELNLAPKSIKARIKRLQDKGVKMPNF